jgi:hypothetical protein
MDALSSIKRPDEKSPFDIIKSAGAKDMTLTKSIPIRSSGRIRGLSDYMMYGKGRIFEKWLYFQPSSTDGPSELDWTAVEDALLQKKDEVFLDTRSGSKKHTTSSASTRIDVWTVHLRQDVVTFGDLWTYIQCVKDHYGVVLSQTPFHSIRITDLLNRRSITFTGEGRGKITEDID